MKGPKAENIETMFDSISGDYDKLNHILSLGTDRLWRLRALKEFVDRKNPQSILDIACGTGDFSIAIAEHSYKESHISGLDLSEGMLEIMRRKINGRGLGGRISTVRGNCEKMDFADASFDTVTIGFGIRNFENRETCLKEILRVLKPGGKLVILELSVPEIPVVRGIYKLYLNRILPLIGGRISGNAAAYGYLPASILKFPPRKEWMAVMSSCGFINVSHKAFALGACRMYIGGKLK